jgi:hypothetical protein
MVVALWCVYTKYVSFLTTSLPIFYLIDLFLIHACQ